MKQGNTKFDVIVIGGGHAGVEAAAVSARMGATTALITQRITRIGAMSCNPAIGGLGKGHLVREIDALDGVMARAGDMAAIQYRLLNRRKGPAVQGPRVQTDRSIYKNAIFQILQDTKGLAIVEGECSSLIYSEKRVSGLELVGGQVYNCGAVILTAGTFLNGMIHRGKQRFSAGRINESSVTFLANQLAEIGLSIGRLKTGTPPRLDGRSINFDELEPQWGDDEPQFLSALTTQTTAPQCPCYLTRTTAATHAIVKGSLAESAVYSGAILGNGPRYCPSIEDKIVKFSERESHQVFLEPEGLSSNSIYPNGISTSLPVPVQAEMVRSLEGLRSADLVQSGYAIEYDYVNPLELLPTLMTRRLAGLFLAGQINGTTGYEEAAAQGIAAGIGASLYAGGKSAQIFSRSNSYIGVLIDDLITRGVTEPYRMFTSRAEFRLSLRADNADERLTPVGERIGAITCSRYSVYENTLSKLAEARALLNGLSADSRTLAQAGFNVGSDYIKRTAFGWASLPEIRLLDLARLWPKIASIEHKLLPRLDADAKYQVYVERQKKDIERQQADESLIIPPDFDFFGVAGLSNELKVRFTQKRPTTIGHASRLEGATPAALLLLAAHARRVTHGDLVMGHMNE